VDTKQIAELYTAFALYKSGIISSEKVMEWLEYFTLQDPYSAYAYDAAMVKIKEMDVLHGVPYIDESRNDLKDKTFRFIEII